MAKKKTPAFGLVKFGSGRRHSAISLAIPTGALLAALVAGFVPLFRNDYPIWWQVFLVFFICLIPVFVALAWILMVDIDTIPGRVSKPEQSVESMWASRAAENSFYTISAGIGLVTAGFAIFGSVNESAILVWVIVGMWCIYGFFYLRAKFGK